VAGNTKQAVGKVVGDQETVADGKTEAVEGKVQNAFGGIKDAIRSVTRNGSSNGSPTYARSCTSPRPKTSNGSSSPR
jgi:uncharacterized protein YjbJ (UPF0337 family)